MEKKNEDRNLECWMLDVGLNQTARTVAYNPDAMNRIPTNTDESANNPQRGVADLSRTNRPNC